MDIPLTRIEACEFRMGSKKRLGQRCGGVPIDAVLTKPFYIGLYPITQKAWFDMMGTAPWESSDVADSQGFRCGDDIPVVGVTYFDAASFVSSISNKTGRRYCLPTELQWECAIRSGTSTEYFWGDDPCQAPSFAWCEAPDPTAENIPDEYFLHTVGCLQPNPSGTYDMAGLVREWVRDKCTVSADSPYLAGGHYPNPARDFCGMSGSHRMVKNGHFRDVVTNCASYTKHVVSAEERSVTIGFRVAMEE